VSAPEACACGSGRDYRDCCEPFHRGLAQPPSPLALMRSRYCAFSLGLAGYLRATVHPALGGAGEDSALEETFRSVCWIGLRIVDFPPPLDGRGEVEFVAFHERDGVVEQLHERSLFLREDGRWLYRSGQFLPRLPLGRNDECPCGSGRKFKKCHGR
jgi:SEC-C motif-containing protein